MGRCSDARQRLLDTGARLIHERGYSGVSVADICEDAGLKKGSFYHFFPSKRDLVLAVIDRYAQSYTSLMDGACGGSKGARGKLACLFARMREGMDKSKAEAGCLRGCPVGNLALEMADHDELIRLKLKGIFDAWRDGIVRILEEGIERGELSIDDARGAGEALVAQAQGAILLAKASNDPALFGRLIDTAMDRLLVTPETHSSSAGSNPARART